MDGLREHTIERKSLLELFRKKLEDFVVRSKVGSIEELDEKMRKTADAILKCVY